MRRSIADLLGEDTPAPKRAGGRPVADHRQQLVLAQAEGQRIKNEKLRGELVPAADVQAVWDRAILDLRAALLAVPSRVGSRLGMTPTQIAGLDAEIRDALAVLAAQDGPA